MSSLWVASIMDACFAETTGIAYTICVSGCSIRCPDCHNKELWEMEESGTLVSIEDILKDIKRNDELLDAVCILGGEPTDQLEGLKELLKKLQPFPFDVWVYTGREAASAEVIQLLPFCNYIKCGRYIDNTKHTTNTKHTMPSELAGVIRLASDNQYIIRGGRMDANKLYN